VVLPSWELLERHVADGTVDTVLVHDDAERATLADLVRAVAVSQAIARSADGVERPGDLRLMATYEHYWIAALETGGGYEAILQPDDDGRRFFPFFTHRQALERALPGFSRDLPERTVATTRATGAQLCEIVAQEEVDGIVVDHLGPATPRAFAIGALDLWREAL
jgi:hypothetical protein